MEYIFFFILAYDRIKSMKVGDEMSTIAFTHIGNLRQENEDSYYYNELENIYIVADGIGGHQGGRDASRLAIKAFLHIYDQYKESSLEKVIESGFRFANEQVFHYQNTHFPNGLVGTTLTVIILRKNKVYLGHVGDSRAYLYTFADKLVQISEDHTYYAELAKYDNKTSMKIKSNTLNDKKNFLLKAIGPEKEVSVQIDSYEVKGDFILLLATDGLYRYILIDEIVEIVEKNKNLALVSDRLKSLALSRGGKDNLTMIILTMEEGDLDEPKIRGTI